MRIRIAARHIVIRMITGNHHDWHQRNVLDPCRLELRNDILEMRPALDGINEDIFQLRHIDARLND